MGGGYCYKISDILTHDVKSVNKYLLIVIILVILTCAGGTSYALFSYEVYAPSTIHIRYNPPATCDEIGIDESGATSPKENLPSNMIAVCYDSKNDVWRKADTNNIQKGYKWYSYSDKVWANAVTVSDVNTTTSITLNTKEQQSCDGKCNREDYLNAPIGSVIPLSDINTMFVWIPRFSATMTDGQAGDYNSSVYCSDSAYTNFDACNSAGETWYDKGYLNPGAFDIRFVGKNESAHDAFTFGEEVEGLWVGKFENSSNTTCEAANYSEVGSNCNLTTIRPKILPNEISWRGAMESTIFYNILAMTDSGNQYGFSSSEVDTHMMKSSEWGAVAYLSQSIYGTCLSSSSCNKVRLNSNKNYITGCGVQILESDADGYLCNEYNSELGILSSTTGNVYGIYDMSGGIAEKVMGVYWDGIKLWSGYSLTDNKHSGFNGYLNNDGITYEDGVSYPSDSKYYNLFTSHSATGNLQYTLYETKEWYGSYGYFPNKNLPWLCKGDNFGYSNASIFSYNQCSAGTYKHDGSRTVLVK